MNTAAEIGTFFDNMVSNFGSLYERNDSRKLRLLAAGVASGKDARNVRATLAEIGYDLAAELDAPTTGTGCVECGNEVSLGARYCELCADDLVAAELADALRAPLMLATGTYTLVYAEGTYFTFRVREVKTGKLAGKTVVEHLTGPNNSLDFEPFAFLNPDTINVWKRYERGDMVNRAREIEAIARDDKAGLEAAGLRYAMLSSRCRRCNKVLTVPASVASGFGPDCAALLGVAYGETEPVGGETKASRKTRKPDPMPRETEAKVWQTLAKQASNYAEA